MKRIMSMCLMIALVLTTFAVPTVFASESILPVIDFGNYTNETYTSQATGLDFTNGNTAIAQGENASLKLSSVHKGATPSNAKTWIANGNAYVYAGNASQQAMLNLDAGDVKFTDIDKISFDVINPDAGRKRSMVSVLVGPNEQQAYMFAIDGDDWWADYNKRTTRQYTPFVRKYDNYSYAGGVLATDFTYSGATLTADNSTAPTLSTGTDITWTYTGGTIRTICGPWDGGTNYFGKNFSKAHWDIEFDTDTNKISWTVSLWSRDDEPALMYTWSDSIIDEDLKSRMENMVYPISMGVQTNTLGYSNIKIYGEVEKNVSLSDDFSSYTSENSVVSTLRYDSISEITSIGTNTKHSWKTSAVNKALYQGSGNGKMYMDVANDRLAISGMGSWHLATVNLDMGDTKKIDTLKKIEFSTTNGTRFQGIAAFISGDENNFILFGQRGYEELTGGFSQGDSSVHAPVIYKKVNGTLSVVAYDTTASKWSSSDKDLNWIIDIDGNNISYKVVSNNDTTWEGSFTDTDNLCTSNFRYPVAAAAIGDQFGYLNSVSLVYTEYQGTEYEKKAYTYDEFNVLMENALYSGRLSDLDEVVSLDLSDIILSESSANVEIKNKVATADNDTLAIHFGFESSAQNYLYPSYFNEDGTFTDSFLSIAPRLSYLSNFRLGGTEINYINYFATIGDYDSRQDSYFVSLPDDLLTKYSIGSKSSGVIRMGLDEMLKVIEKINPNATITPVISPYVMTPQDTKNLIEYIQGDETTTYGAKRIENGIKTAFKIDYIEIGNEVDKSGRADWYVTEAKKHIAAIEEKDSSIKVMLCGPTAVWDANWWPNGDWVDNWVSPLAKELGAISDAVSFHTYYYGNAPEYLLYLSDTIYNEFKTYNANIKMAFTEHAKWWHNDYKMSANYIASLYTMKQIDRSLKRGYMDGMHLHCMAGSVWGFMTYDMQSSATEKLYSLIAGHLSGDVLDTSVTFTGSTDSSWNTGANLTEQLSVTPVITGRGEMSLIVSNFSPYDEIELTFSGIDSSYKLVKEEYLDSPNAFVFAYNDYSEDLIVQKENNYNYIDFSTYTAKPKSVSVLTLKKKVSDYEVNESFETNSEFVSASASAENTLSQNDNGFLWKTSKTNPGAGKVVRTYYGKAKTDSGKLVLSTHSNNPLSINLVTNGFSGSIDEVKKLTFTLQNPNEAKVGVKLFLDESENSSYVFSNEMAGFDTSPLKVCWTINIEDDTLYWQAKRDDGVVKEGIMSYSAAEYKYLLSVFASAHTLSANYYETSFEDLTLYYNGTQNADRYTIENNENSVDVKIIPSMYENTETIKVIAVYLNENEKISQIVDIDVNMQLSEDVVSFEKTSTYNGVKIYVWKSLDSMQSLENAVQLN